MKGASGKVGDMLVFKQWFGKTVIGKTPRKSGSNTTAQHAIRARFQEAVIYAKGVLANAATKQSYMKKALPGQTAYNLALADFFTPPTIGKVDTSAYTGPVGGIIRIQASDDFLVKSVAVKITKADGTLIEQGAAVADADGVHWNYTTTVANAALSGTKIAVTAMDLPANVTENDTVLP